VVNFPGKQTELIMTFPSTTRLSFEASNQHLNRAEALIPGGAHTYARGADQYPEGMAPFIVSGKGCRVLDADGNEFIEYGMGLRAVTLGHAFEPVEQAVIAQIKQGVNFARPHVLEVIAAETLLDVIPSGEMVKFGVNGSDVTTAAVKLARAYTGRNLVARCQDQPFFSTDDWFMGTTAMSAGIPAEVVAMTHAFPYNDVAALEQLLEAHPNQFAAIILEAETTTPPAAGYFDAIRSLCNKHGVVFILDEIITGFRWSTGGAQAVYDIQPDLTTFAKGIANGFPGAALVGKRDIMRLGGFVEDRDRVFLLSQTYGGAPWSLAAMLATITHYREHHAAEQLHRIGNDLRKRLQTIIDAAGLGDFVRLMGRDCNLVFAACDADRQPSQGFRTLLLQELIGNGIISSSLVVSTAHDDSALQRTEAAFAAAMPIYAAALESGLDGHLRGRPVRPALRARG
jgi:glutamate-1-semialdehyde 2,1-aminomutase